PAQLLDHRPERLHPVLGALHELAPRGAGVGRLHHVGRHGESSLEVVSGIIRRPAAAGNRRPLVRALLLAGLALAPAPASAGHGAPIPVVTTEVTYAKRLLDAGQPLVFVDLRPAAEFARGRLPHALSIPLPELRRRYQEIPR